MGESQERMEASKPLHRSLTVGEEGGQMEWLQTQDGPRKVGRGCQSPQAKAAIWGAPSLAGSPLVSLMCSVMDQEQPWECASEPARSSGFQISIHGHGQLPLPVAAELQGVCLGPPAHRTGLYVVPQSKAGQGEVGGKNQEEQSCGF